MQKEEEEEEEKEKEEEEEEMDMEKVREAIVKNISKEDAKEIIATLLGWDPHFKLHIFLTPELKFKDFSWIPRNTYVNYSGYKGIVLEFKDNDGITFYDLVDDYTLDDMLKWPKNYKYNPELYRAIIKFKKYLEDTSNPYPTIQEQLVILDDYYLGDFNVALDNILMEDDIYYIDQETYKKLLKMQKEA